MVRASSIKCSDYELGGQAAILVIPTFINIIKNRISKMRPLGYSAITITSIVWNTRMHRARD